MTQSLRGFYTLLAFAVAVMALAHYFPAPPDSCPQNAISIDEEINQILCPISHRVSSIVFFNVTLPLTDQQAPFVVLLLISTALILTFYLKFINLRGLPQAWRIAKETYRKPHEGDGEISHFQALTAALSGTVGLGNIAGVAIAIYYGGPGAIFWMVCAGFLATATKFAECSLASRYRLIHKDGAVSGGAMYYLSMGLKERGLAPLGHILACAFALFCIGGAIGAGNMFQANQAFEQLNNVSGGALDGYAWLFGGLFALLVGSVIIGGIKSIGRVTEILIPFMGAIYIIACSVVILTHIDQLPHAVGIIITQAFTPEAQYGGFIGVMIWGFKRAAFSNEAGLGSAPIAYAAVKTRQPLSTGYISLLEPIIDTIIICSMTGLVIVITGTYAGGETPSGVTMTSHAFAQAIHWFPYVLTLAILLFAFSTLITWSYYGLQGWNYLFGRSPFMENIFKIIFCLFIIVGAALNLGQMVALSESMIFLMVVPNVLGLILLAPRIKKELAS